MTSVFLRKRPGACSFAESLLCHYQSLQAGKVSSFVVWMISFLIAYSSVLCQGFKVGYVVFKDSSALDRALMMDPAVDRYLSTPNCPIVTGMKSILSGFRRFVRTELTCKFNEFVN